MSENDESPREPREGALRTGSVVRLKSGGPAMTVQWHDAENDSVVCTWQFRGRASRERYFATMLERCEPDAQAPGFVQKRGAKRARRAKG
jgi:uncharacterized protein YodC (DUF2158 family)